MQNLSHHDQQTMASVLRHPTSGNIEWHSLLALFGHLGEVAEETNGKVRLTRNGHSMTIHPRGKDAELDEIIEIRKFIKISDKPEGTPADGLGDFLVVIEHSEARVYRTESPGAEAVHIQPYDPSGWDRHVHSALENASDHTAALHREFFERIAVLLDGAKRILVFGSGRGSSQEFERFGVDLEQHHPLLAKLVVRSVVVDLSHLTGGEILAKAREIFAEVPPISLG